ncbi:serine/threonine-protein kinase [Neorhodopirellula lusitana]|uniref:serine/threonine-protein kinase n=1 Tax=Neorhodopirellula lusitana TaxID=445327 RepID=UPI00384EBB78
MASSQHSETSATASTHLERSTSRRFWVCMALGFLLVMLAPMIWVFGQVNESSKQLCQRALQTVLEGNVARLRLNVLTLKQEAAQLAKNPTVLRLVREGTAQPKPATTDSADGVPDGVPDDIQKLRELFPNLPEANGWVVTNPDGIIIAADSDSRLGERCPWTPLNRSTLQSGKQTVVLPDYASDSSSLGCLFTLAPILSAKERHFEMIGSVGWVVDPRDYLSDLLGTNRTDATCLFDRYGRLLTRSRFEDQLSNLRVDQPTEAQRPWYPTLLRQPGFDSRESGTNLNTETLADCPLTKMADRAIRGSAGSNTQGYRDYRGVTVVGAWRWMPDLRIGIATEIDSSEAFRSINLMKWLIAGTFGALTFAGIGLATLAVLSERLRQRLNDRDEDVRHLGQYELTELLGAGGMGAVYRGKHQFLRRDVAIKVLEGEQLSRQSIARFRREVQLTSNLRHPNTIAIYDYGQAENLSGAKSSSNSDSKPGSDTASSNNKKPPQFEQGVFYYVMEYIDGISLQQLIDFYGPQSPERTIHLLRQICGSIAEAHEAGLIHRDIKPANILLSAKSNTYDHIKVLDFGLVKELNKADDTLAMTMTRSDSMTGTPLYMAPETIRDATQAGPAGDLYSIGAVGYSLLTGKSTYEGESAIDLCLKQLERPPVSPEIRLGRSLPQGLQEIIMKCLSLRPEDRPASIGQLLKSLDSLPEASEWNQTDSIDWWENVFEANRQKTPVETKAGTVADRPLEGIS